MKINPGESEIKRALVVHVHNLEKFYGEVLGVRIARKHVGWYLSGRVSVEFMRKFNGLQSTEEQVEAIIEAFLEDIAA